MTLTEAIAETIRRAQKDQEFLRKTLERRRKEEADADQKKRETEEKRRRHQE